MAFADPQVVTINSVAKSMPRVSSIGLTSIYQMADQTYKMTLSHTPSKGRIRSMARLDERAIVPDPLTAVNDYETESLYVVYDRPEAGFSSATAELLRAGFIAWLNSSNFLKLFGQES